MSEAEGLQKLIDALLRSVGGAAKCMLDHVGVAQEIRFVVTRDEAEMQIWVGNTVLARQVCKL